MLLLAIVGAAAYKGWPGLQDVSHLNFITGAVALVVVLCVVISMWLQLCCVSTTQRDSVLHGACKGYWTAVAGAAVMRCVQHVREVTWNHFVLGALALTACTKLSRRLSWAWAILSAVILIYCPFLCRAPWYLFLCVFGCLALTVAGATSLALQLLARTLEEDEAIASRVVCVFLGGIASKLVLSLALQLPAFPLEEVELIATRVACVILGGFIVKLALEGAPRS